MKNVGQGCQASELAEVRTRKPLLGADTDYLASVYAYPPTTPRKPWVASAKIFEICESIPGAYRAYVGVLACDASCSQTYYRCFPPELPQHPPLCILSATPRELLLSPDGKYYTPVTGVKLEVIISKFSQASINFEGDSNVFPYSLPHFL